MDDRQATTSLLAKICVGAGILVCLLALDYSTFAPMRTRGKAGNLRLLIKETIQERLYLESRIYDKKLIGENTTAMEDRAAELLKKQKEYEEEYTYLSVAQKRPMARRPGR